MESVRRVGSRYIYPNAIPTVVSSALLFLAAFAATGEPIHPQVLRAANQNAKAKLDPILADGWLQCLVEDGLVFTADKVGTASCGSLLPIAVVVRARDDIPVSIGSSVSKRRLHVCMYALC